ncbi:hypothetical protein [uncultured Clostridium sp.]|uniref:hypothetical protein n=1 Tax=uncultured Clostridium sp. TaxID=59620 RepID=UPI0028E71A3A|nr:hypothetical protein [uncultured Clostridium sp.]
MNKVNEIKNLEEICKPVVDYLKKNWDPHCTVVITDSQIRLVRDEIGIPVGTAQEVPVQEQLTESEKVILAAAKIKNNIKY